MVRVRVRVVGFVGVFRVRVRRVRRGVRVRVRRVRRGVRVRVHRVRRGVLGLGPKSAFSNLLTGEQAAGLGFFAVPDDHVQFGF